MTVPGETSTVPAQPLDRAAAEERMNELYRECWRGIHAFIWSRMEQRHVSMAEDLAADTFVLLWTKYLAAGKDVTGSPFGLLCTLARHRIADFYKVRANRSVAVDFTDAANGYLERGHSYATHQPEAALIARDLHAAMETMADLSQQWRDAHAGVYRQQRELDANRRLTPEERKTLKARARRTASASDRLLVRFREACAAVGALRAEMEAAAGPNWQSSTGLPVGDLKPASCRSADPAATHCRNGHELTRDNTAFAENGRKECRTCLRNPARANQPAMPKVDPYATGVRRARNLLRTTTKSMRQIAKEVGVPRATLIDRIPDLHQLRDMSATRITRIPDEVIERAAALLTDPDNLRSLRSVSQEVGVDPGTLYGRIPDLAKRRQQIYGDAYESRFRPVGAGR